MKSRAWMDSAVCRDVDATESDLFYPERGEGSEAEYELAVNAAKAHCRRCPVADDCLLMALADGQVHGIWGGMTPEERADMLQAATA